VPNHSEGSGLFKSGLPLYPRSVASFPMSVLFSNHRAGNKPTKKGGRPQLGAERKSDDTRAGASERELLNRGSPRALAAGACKEGSFSKIKWAKWLDKGAKKNSKKVNKN